jgi:hypothetical protein
MATPQAPQPNSRSVQNRLILWVIHLSI